MPYKSYDVSLENVVLDQVIIHWYFSLFSPIVCLILCWCCYKKVCLDNSSELRGYRKTWRALVVRYFRQCGELIFEFFDGKNWFYIRAQRTHHFFQKHVRYKSLIHVWKWKEPLKWFLTYLHFMVFLKEVINMVIDKFIDSLIHELCDLLTQILL